MKGSVSQVIALATHGNEFLRKDRISKWFYPHNVAFKFCNKVDFRELKKIIFLNPKEIVVSEDPFEWFSYLKCGRCMYLRVYFQPRSERPGILSHQLAGFVGGGGAWMIEAVYKSYSDFWSPRWEVSDKDHPKRIWTVNYGRTIKNGLTKNIQINENEVKDELDLTLAKISEFAFSRKLDDWGKIFKHSRTILNSEQPEQNSYYKKLIPIRNYSLAARQILFAASSSWVFGGMGSWNDVGYAVENEFELYKQLSAELYDNINRSVVSAVNSY